MEKTFFKKSGFTLIEILIGLGVSAILILGLTRLFSATLNSYSLQDQLTEMNQNAKFVMEELSEVLMQAGANCAAVNSDTTDKDTIIKPNGSTCSDFTIKVNPRGGLFVMASPCTLTMSAKCSLQVDSAYPFRNAKYLEKIPCQTPPTARRITIDSLLGIDSISNRFIYIMKLQTGTTKDTFCINDAICSICNHRYYLSGTSLCLDSDSNVLAENIDSLKITFMDSTGTTTTSWNLIKSVGLVLESTTSLPDNRYANPPWNDHLRRLKLTYQFRLKNKV